MQLPDRNLTCHLVTVVLSLLAGIFLNSYFVIQGRHGASDMQMIHVNSLLDEARQLDHHSLKVYFGLYKQTREMLLGHRYNLTYFDQDEECIKLVASVREGSPEYYQVIHQRGCHRMYSPYTEISWQ